MKAYTLESVKIALCQNFLLEEFLVITVGTASFLSTNHKWKIKFNR